MRAVALPWEPGRFTRLAIVLAGIIAGQVVLYGPSLTGRKVLLPLDILSSAHFYLPPGAGTATIEPAHRALQDLVLLVEPWRRFAASELRAGRLPMWNPYQYAGAPCIWPKFSPFLLLSCCTASPVILAWTQLLSAIVAGLGAYVFCRRVIEVGFWPGAIVGWCYPLTGFFVFWQGYATSLPVCWLPWILLAVDGTVRGVECRVASGERGSGRAGSLPGRSSFGEGGSAPRTGLFARNHFLNRAAPLGLSLATSLVVVSGQLDIAAQVLLVSALYAARCLVAQVVRSKRVGEPVASTESCSGKVSSFAPRPSPLAPILRLAAGWGLGLLLAAPAVLPVAEYSRTGVRMERRTGGEEDRPPVGLRALPGIVLPDVYGKGVPYAGNAQSETSSAAYAGLLATLVVAPLAWADRRHRRLNLFWAGLLFFSVSWCLNIPGLVQLLRLPGLRMLSHNRWVFAGSFALSALTATGLEQLFQGHFRWRRWCWAPAVVLAGLCLWSALRAAWPPELLATRLERAIAQGQTSPLPWITSLEEARQLKASFFKSSVSGATWCGIGLVGWLALWLRTRTGATRSLPAAASRQRKEGDSGADSSGIAADKDSAESRAAVRGPGDFGLWTLDFGLCRSWPVPAVLGIAALLTADLLWFAYGRNPQSDPALYYPNIPALRQLAEAGPGRIIGYDCLPANLATVCGLHDIRGYDAVDPARLVELTQLGCYPPPPLARYALMQWMFPKAWLRPAEGTLVLSPVLDMLGVRYIVFRGKAPANVVPAIEGQDYSVFVNRRAMERVYVPKRVATAFEPAARLKALAATDFDPREVAYVESAVNLPGPCRGQAAILKEIPTRLVVSARMETDGLLVLADLWDKGWRAYLGGQPVPILRADHALRGVVVPKGNWTLEFRYEPASFAWAMRMTLLAALILIAWLAILWTTNYIFTPGPRTATNTTATTNPTAIQPQWRGIAAGGVQEASHWGSRNS